ncbi:MAG: HAMP domain-containing sensor histidine kinase [Planctomycetota bacterium]
MTWRIPFIAMSIACFVVLVGALGWIGHQVLDLERRELLASAQSEHESKVRLALWRIDSEVGTVLAIENARPFADYLMPSSVHGGKKGSARDGNDRSQLDPEAAVHAMYYFQIDPKERLVAANGLNRQLNPSVGSKDDTSKPESDQAESATPFTSDPNHRDAAPISKDAVAFLCNVIPFQASPSAAFRRNQSSQPTNASPSYSSPESRLSRQSANEVEFQQRLSNVNRSQTNFKTAANQMAESIREGWLVPAWRDGALFLARRVVIRDQEYIQGFLVNWSDWKRSLLRSIHDLLPDADLELAQPEASVDPMRRLASLPVQIVVPTVAAPRIGWFTPIRIALFVAWLCMLLAYAAVTLLLVGAVRLSERRADFVSAVTHELRTPITTFRMYADMLAEGMVPDEERRQRYFETLRAEADRLAHLVENVLAYARLERGRAGGEPQTLSIGQLTDLIRPRLEDRTKNAQMQFVTNTGNADGATVTVDPLAVEQILFNLVDNACKYAFNAKDRRILLDANADPRFVRFTVRDFGDGVLKREARGLFTPFGKSAKKAAETAPGIGLGLTLSRRLARRMHGDLSLDRSVESGAAFVLALPRANGQS